MSVISGMAKLRIWADMDDLKTPKESKMEKKIPRKGESSSRRKSRPLRSEKRRSSTPGKVGSATRKSKYTESDKNEPVKSNKTPIKTKKSETEKSPVKNSEKGNDTQKVAKKIRSKPRTAKTHLKDAQPRLHNSKYDRAEGHGKKGLKRKQDFPGSKGKKARMDGGKYSKSDKFSKGRPKGSTAGYRKGNPSREKSTDTSGRYFSQDIKQSIRRGKSNVIVRPEYDPYAGPAPVDEKLVKKYRRGRKPDVRRMESRFQQDKLKKLNQAYENVAELSARAELVQPEQPGHIIADEGEQTSDYTQYDIASCVDIASADKFFELKLDKFGPYRVNYSKNGRYLLLGGARGHVAAIDWQTKKLMCELNVMQTCSDIKWLHIETMFAVAQRQWTYIYDNMGVELHCLKAMDSVLRMEFLPYHFLLVSGNAKGYLQWVDVSMGKKVAGHMTGLGRLDVMCQNPSNAIIHTGHTGGTVTLWSPNVREPLVKMLCHKGGVRSLAVTKDGRYMATSGIERTLKIWDLRMFKLNHGYHVGMGAGHLSFSHQGMLAAAMGNVVEIYKDPCGIKQKSPYLTHQCSATVGNLQFCPYEDVLGLGHGNGFSSILVPGAGEPNFDALEDNPYRSRKQRAHWEVKMLMEKIQPDMISLDTKALGKVDKETLQEKQDARNKLLYLKPAKLDFTPRYKKKGGSKAGRLEKRKAGVQSEHLRKHIVSVRKEEASDDSKQSQKATTGPYNPLDRFNIKPA